MRQFLALGSAAIAIAVCAGAANAQCALQHPRKTRAMTLPLVQAFVPCNVDAVCTDDGHTRTSNTFTEIGVPGCQSPETYHARSGSPSNGWRWGSGSSGTVTFKAMQNKIAHPLNPQPNTADVSVRVDLAGIEDADGPVEGYGTLVPLRRTTFEDRLNGDMTVLDLPFPSFPVHVSNGRAKLKTSANAALNASGFPGAPGCTSLELGRLVILDENADPFATPGLFLPDIN